MEAVVEGDGEGATGSERRGKRHAQDHAFQHRRDGIFIGGQIAQFKNARRVVGDDDESEIGPRFARALELLP